MLDFMNGIFDNEFIALLERWVVIPFVGYLIAHGFFGADSKDSLVALFDNILGTAFVFFFYYVTHPRVNPTDPKVSNMLSTLWTKVSNFVFAKPKDPAELPADGGTPTDTVSSS